MTDPQIITAVAEFVEAAFAGVEVGHDWPHVRRVWQLAKHIATQEQLSAEECLIVELGALLHDIADTKFHDDPNLPLGRSQALLQSLYLPDSVVTHVLELIQNVSFKGGSAYQTFDSLPLRIVQDADRLEAIGAIGIARTFSYGSHRNRPFYDPEQPPQHNLSPEAYRKNNSATINHFYEKLLLLKDRMNTPTAQAMAQKRHQVMEDFLAAFLEEWHEGQP